jgi:ElaB/YqjD/DUF883 family membrane-anchored ribosome-binding protein
MVQDRSVSIEWSVLHQAPSEWLTTQGVRDMSASLNPIHNEKLMADLRAVIADAEELLRMGADQAGDQAAAWRVRIQERIDQARITLSHLQETAVDRAKAASRATDDYVHEHPWKAVGMAAGVGLILGMLIGRR